MLISPLTDGKLITNSLENAYQQIWNDYVSKNLTKKSYKVIIDAVFFQLYQTGIARVWSSLLKEWAKTDFAQYILVLDRDNTAPKIKGISYRNIPPYSYDNVEKDRQLLQRICDEEKADLFISSYYTTPLNTPSLFIAYDLIPEVLGYDLKEQMWQEKHRAINHASGFIAISQHTAKDLNKFFPQISLDSIKIAYCGVSSSFYPSSESEISDFKAKYGIQKPYFLLGSLFGYKNSLLFLKAFAKLLNKTDFDIVSTGAGNNLPNEWRQYTYGCTFHSLNLSDNELRLAYGGARALVYPSKYEGFGMPVLEAMACGCPVITTRNASLSEVGGEAVIYVEDNDINDMIEALLKLENSEIRDNLIKAGVKQAKFFSWQKMAKVMERKITQTIDKYY
ncbi:MAG: glycosyltransferase family 4 protein [Cyanobacterium sp. T60_A2020_053]|nr:glycosyltransferase family 4 protein [Cyanobacterium sp. T60_A2020_053]